MKNFIPFVLIIGLVFSFQNLRAQEDKSQRISPPKSFTQTIKNKNQVNLSYSVLSVREREIWGKLVPFDKIWRTGANEASIIEFTKDCKLNGHEIKAGKYSLFTIPNKDGKWIVILNTVAHQWGAYEYDESKDALRFKAKAKTNKEFVEKLVMEVSEKGKFSLKWEYLELNFDIK